MHFDVLFSIPLGIYTIFFYSYIHVCVSHWWRQHKTWTIKCNIPKPNGKFIVPFDSFIIHSVTFDINIIFRFMFGVQVCKCNANNSNVCVCMRISGSKSQSSCEQTAIRMWSRQSFFFGRGKVKYHKLSKTTVFGITSTQPTIVLHRTFESK